MSIEELREEIKGMWIVNHSISEIHYEYVNHYQNEIQMIYVNRKNKV